MSPVGDGPVAEPRLARGGRGEGLRRVEAEIRQAKAQALGRVGERLDAVLGQLRVLDAALDARLAGEARRDEDRALPRALDDRNRLREEACRLVHQLIVQREAVGFRRHALVAERYPVPPRRHIEVDGTAC
jgi:hypothetical protein